MASSSTPLNFSGIQDNESAACSNDPNSSQLDQAESKLSKLERCDSPEANTNDDDFDRDPVNEELLKIEELDASIHDLELKMEEVSNELVNIQIQNRDKLKQILLSSPPEFGSLAKNTQKFFNLYTNHGLEKKIHNKAKSLPKLIKKDLEDELLKTDDDNVTHNAACKPEELSFTDEEKQQIDGLMPNELILNQFNDNSEESNPFFIDEGLKKWLEELDKQILELELDERNQNISDDTVDEATGASP